MPRYSSQYETSKRCGRSTPQRMPTLEKLESRYLLTAVVPTENVVTFEVAEVHAGGFVDISSTNNLGIDQFLIHSNAGQLDLGNLPPETDGLGAGSPGPTTYWTNEGGITRLRPVSTSLSFGDGLSIEQIPLPEIEASPEPRIKAISLNPKQEGGTIDLARSFPYADPAVEEWRESSRVAEEQISEREIGGEDQSTLAGSAVSGRRMLTASPRTTPTDVSPSSSREITFRLAALAPPSEIKQLPESSAGSQGNQAAAEALSPRTAIPAESRSISPGFSAESDTFETRRTAQPSADSVSASAVTNEKTESAQVFRHRTATDSAVENLFDSGESFPDSAVVAKLASSEEEVLQLVYAEWKSREMLSASLILAITTGPMLARRRRNLQPDEVQLPSKRNPNL